MQFEKIQYNAPKVPELVMNSILNAIDSGKIKLYEELLPERELAASLGVGRGSLRECLAILEFLGVIQSRGNRKIAVKTSEYIQEAIRFIKLSERDDLLDDFIEFRRVIEIDIARIACERATEDDLKLLQESVDKLALDPYDHTADTEFHIRLAEASHNAMFAAVIALVNSMIVDLRIRFFQYPDYHTKTLESHRNIFLAVKNRDAIKAAEEMGRHLDNIQNFSKTSPDLPDENE